MSRVMRTTKTKAWAWCRTCGKPVYLVGADADDYLDAPHHGATHFTCGLVADDPMDDVDPMDSPRTGPYWDPIMRGE